MIHTLTQSQMVTILRQLDEARVYLSSIPVFDYSKLTMAISYIDQMIDEIETKYWQDTGNRISAYGLRDEEAHQ